MSTPATSPAVRRPAYRLVRRPAVAPPVLLDDPLQRYVIEHTLSGRSEMLKERTIGIEVFGRPTTYDPSDDATVRVKAGDVRKRLGLYYSAEGAHNAIRIELPSGTYVPEFHTPVAPAPIPIAASVILEGTIRIASSVVSRIVGSIKIETATDPAIAEKLPVTSTIAP